MKKLLKNLLVLFVLISLFACNNANDKQEDKTIKVGATLVPHAEILKNVVKPILEAEGWKLEVVEFNDYVTPNTALEEGELDANYFQTLGYMKDQNENGGLHLVAVAGVHIEPMGLYSNKYSPDTEWELEDGSKIGVPNDTDNYNRAIDFLNACGYLNGTGNENEINGNDTINPRKFEIVPIEAAGLPRALDDLDAAVINGNYALEANLPEKTGGALITEQFDSESSVKRTNYVVVKEGNENSEKINALVNAITNIETAIYIEQTYKGAVISSFVDANGNPINTGK